MDRIGAHISRSCGPGLHAVPKVLATAGFLDVSHVDIRPDRVRSSAEWSEAGSKTRSSRILMRMALDQARARFSGGYKGRTNMPGSVLAYGT